MATALCRLLLQRTGSIPVASPAMLLLVRCCSTAPTQPAAASSEEYCCSTSSTQLAAASSEEYCYALGAFGKMQFSRQQFIPFDKYMKENENSILEPVPMDRLISPPVDRDFKFFTSESAKQFIRSGYLAARFAKILKLSISGAFADGNVGVISGLNILAFLKLDTELSSVPDPYPFTYSGFSSFLEAKMIENYSASKARRMSDGLRELMKLSHDPTVSDLRVIFHPEFLSLEAIASIYIEAHRILRRQMPSTGEDRLAHAIIMHLDAKLGKDYFNLCASDPILSGWLGQQANDPGLAGALGLSVPPGAELNLALLNRADRKKLQKLTRKVYGMSPSSAESTKAPPTPPVYPRDPIIPINFKETRVLDVHRHCMIHVVKDETVAKFFEVLPGPNITSLRNKKPSRRDGVYLLLHKFGSYPHYLAEAFDKFGIWGRLDLESRCPIPQIFFSPPFRHVDAEEGIQNADVR